MVVMQRVNHEEALQGWRLQIGEEGTVTQVTETHAIVVGDVVCTDGPAWDELPFACLRVVLDCPVSRHNAVEWALEAPDWDDVVDAVLEHAGFAGTRRWLRNQAGRPDPHHRHPDLEALRHVLEDLEAATPIVERLRADGGEE